ncbi:MAG: hypothetical protein WKF90_16955 [Pyrinomonadaceae bacterium]
MSQSTLNCSKCTGEMVEGFTVDYDYGSIRPSDWVEGQPIKSSFWCGGTKINDKQVFVTKTYRCSDCGFLESYATEEGSAAY